MLGNPIRFGKNGTAGTPSDMWLPVYGGEVLTAWARSAIFAKLVRMRTVTHKGQVEKFPCYWRLGSVYHEAGVTLVGQELESREISVRLDDRPLAVPYELDEIDEKFAHFDIRNPISTAAGEELGQQTDRKLASLIANAALTAASGSFAGGGIDANGATINLGSDIDADGDAGALAFMQALERTAIFWSTRDYPATNWYAACSPGVWHKMESLGVPRAVGDLDNTVGPLTGNANFNPGQPTSPFRSNPGTFGVPLYYKGFHIYWSNNIPSTNVTTGPQQYRGNFTNIRGLIWQPDAVAALAYGGIMTDTEHSARRGADFFVTKMLMGGDPYRREVAVAVTNL